MMKDLLGKIVALSVTLGLIVAMIVMVNCTSDKDNYQYSFSIEVVPDGLAKCCESFGDFNSASYTGTSFESYESPMTVYIDARTSEGLCTWDYPNQVVEYSDATVQVTPTSPALYLHLVVNAWDDFASTSKKWVMKDVLGEDNEPATDAELDNFTDDVIIFRKDGAAEYYPGDKRSEEEDDILEGENRDSYFGSYRITGTEADGLKVIITPANQDDNLFEVVESGYNTLTLKVTREGKTGYLILEPAE